MHVTAYPTWKQYNCRKIIFFSFCFFLFQINIQWPMLVIITIHYNGPNFQSFFFEKGFISIDSCKRKKTMDCTRKMFIQSILLRHKRCYFSKQNVSMRAIMVYVISDWSHDKSLFNLINKFYIETVKRHLFWNNLFFKINVILFFYWLKYD